MRHDPAYSSKNVIFLVAIFVVLFWLLYSLVNALAQSQQIQSELDGIVAQNDEIQARIEDKKREAEYLVTSQRVDKEAKIQMGRKNPGERVMVFIEEKLDIIPTAKRLPVSPIQEEDVPPFEKWLWVFFGKK